MAAELKLEAGIRTGIYMVAKAAGAARPADWGNVAWEGVVGAVLHGPDQKPAREALVRALEAAKKDASWALSVIARRRAGELPNYERLEGIAWLVLCRLTGISEDI